MYFFALSHAPPAFESVIASIKPDTIEPASMPASAAGPRSNPTATGAMTARSAGAISSFNAACAAMSTHLPYSGLPLPVIMPFIVLNCLLTSITIENAALPTARIVNAENRKGIAPPISRPVRT